jgi:uncharacterized lipoprotein
MENVIARFQTNSKTILLKKKGKKNEWDQVDSFLQDIIP